MTSGHVLPFVSTALRFSNSHSYEHCSRNRHIATCSGKENHKYPAEEERGVEKGLGHAGHVSPFENTD